MKKLVSNIWLITALVLGFVACTSEVDDVYDKPISERVSDVIKNDMAILTSAQKGWVMAKASRAIWNSGLSVRPMNV